MQKYEIMICLNTVETTKLRGSVSKADSQCGETGSFSMRLCFSASAAERLLDTMFDQPIDSVAYAKTQGQHHSRPAKRGLFELPGVDAYGQ